MGIPSGIATKSKRSILILLGMQLLVLVSLVYSNVLYGEFQFDDRRNITENEIVTDLSYFSDPAVWSPTMLLQRFSTRPLAYFTFALNYQLGGWNPLGFHTGNIIIHFFAGLALFWLVLLVLQTPGAAAPNRNLRLLAAFAAAAIFLVHPVQTQAVSYIVQRMASMAALFYLLSFALYLKGRLQLDSFGANARVLSLFLLSAVSALLGLWSKEIIFSLPLALLLSEIFLLRDNNGNINRRFAWFWGAIIAAALVTVLFITGLPSDTETVEPIAYLFTQFYAVITYIRLVFIPVGLHADYYFPFVTTLYEPVTLLSLVGLLLLIGFAIYLFRRYRLYSFTIFFFLIALSVESSIIPIGDAFFEHRMYLPMAAAAMAAGFFFAVTLSGIRPSLRIAGLIVLVLTLSTTTYNRNFVWQTEISLWTDNIEKEPREPSAYVRRGVVYDIQGQNQLALQDYETAIAIDSTIVDTYNNRGLLLLETGDFEGALRDFNKCIELVEIDPAIYFNRALAYIYLDSMSAAMNDITRAIGLGSRFQVHSSKMASYFTTRGNIYHRQKNYPRAEKDYLRALTFTPGNAELHANLGNLYSSTGESAKAVEQFDQAVLLARERPEILEARARHYYKSGELAAALRDYSTLINLSPSNGKYYLVRGGLQYELGNFADALSDMLAAQERGVDVDNSLLMDIREKAQANNQIE